MNCGLCNAPIDLCDSWRLAPGGEYHAHSWCLGDIPWERAADAEFERNVYKPRFIVTVWDVDRAMGGMEEGGWSYEEGSLVTSIELPHIDDEEEASSVRQALEVLYPYTGQRGMYSKRGPDYSVRVLDRESQYDLEEHFDERLNLIPNYPVYRPRYE